MGSLHIRQRAAVIHPQLHVWKPEPSRFSGLAEVWNFRLISASSGSCEETSFYSHKLDGRGRKGHEANEATGINLEDNWQVLCHIPGMMSKTRRPQLSYAPRVFLDMEVFQLYSSDVAELFSMLGFLVELRPCHSCRRHAHARLCLLPRRMCAS